MVRAHASESSPLCQALEPFLALKQHCRRWNEGPRCHPQPMLSAHPTLHMWRAPFSNQHHICLHTEASNPPVSFRQVNKMLQIICLLHYSSKCQDSNYNHKKRISHNSAKRICFFFLLTKGIRSGCARPSKGGLFPLQVNLVLFHAASPRPMVFFGWRALE